MGWYGRALGTVSHRCVCSARADTGGRGQGLSPVSLQKIRGLCVPQLPGLLVLPQSFQPPCLCLGILMLYSILKSPDPQASCHLTRKTQSLGRTQHPPRHTQTGHCPRAPSIPEPAAVRPSVPSSSVGITCPTVCLLCAPTGSQEAEGNAVGGTA